MWLCKKPKTANTMERIDVSFLLMLALVGCATGFGMFVVTTETHGLAIVFGLNMALLGGIIGYKCLRPFNRNDGRAEAVLKELAAHLRMTADINPRHEATGERVGSLSLCAKRGALWRRAIDAIGEEPDSIRDAARRSEEPE